MMDQHLMRAFARGRHVAYRLSVCCGVAALMLGAGGLVPVTPAAARTATTNPCFLYQTCASHVLCGWALRGFALHPDEIYFSGINRRKFGEVWVTPLPGEMAIGESGRNWSIDLHLTRTEMSRFSWERVRVVDITLSMATPTSPIRETAHPCRNYPSSIG